MLNPRLGFLLLFAALCAAVPIACDDDEAADRPPGPELELTVGNSLPLSGRLAPFGRPGKKAAELAQEVIEGAIAENGGEQRLRLVHADNGGGSDPELALASARELVEQKRSGCLVGAWATSDTLEIARDVAIPEHVALISPAAPGDELTGLEDEGLVARVAPADATQGEALANAIAADAEPAEIRVGLLARADPYGDAISDRFTEAWRAMGGELAAEVRYAPLTPDLDASAKRIEAADADATVIVDFPDGFAKLVASLTEVGSWDPASTWVPDALAAGDLPDAIEASALEGLTVTAPGIPDSDEATQAFLERLEATEPVEVGRQTFDAHVFDAVVLCYLAAYSAGSADGDAIAAQLDAVSAPPGASYTWQELPEAMATLAAGEEINYEGASGSIDLDRAGDPTAGIYDLFRYRDGELVDVGEVPFGSG